MPQREDLADEQRVVAAVMSRDHFGGDGCVRVSEQRRAAGVVVFQIEVLDRTPGKMTDQSFLAAGEDADAEVDRIR